MTKSAVLGTPHHKNGGRGFGTVRKRGVPREIGGVQKGGGSPGKGGGKSGKSGGEIRAKSGDFGDPGVNPENQT